MRIELDQRQIDEVTRAEIESLNKKITSLSRKVANRDSQINKLKANRRPEEFYSRVLSAAEDLVSVLRDSDLIAYDY